MSARGSTRKPNHVPSEQDQIGAARNLAGCGARIIAGRIHEAEARRSHRLGIVYHRVEWRRSCLCNRTQRFFEYCGDPAGFVSGRGIVVEISPFARSIFLPPVQPVYQSCAPLRGLRRGAATGLRHRIFREFRTVSPFRPHPPAYRRNAERGIRRQRRIAVRRAALQADGKMRRRKPVDGCRHWRREASPRPCDSGSMACHRSTCILDA